MRVAVTTLCEFAARRGDLDYRYTPSPTAREGMEGHARIRKRRDAEYQAEYPLSGVCEGLELSGRADGYAADAGYLEEIKTHRGDLERLPPAQRTLHWAQLSAYGALLCEAEQRPSIELRLTYLDILSDKETVLKEEATAQALWVTLQGLCRDYLEWALAEQAHRSARDSALAAIRFPHTQFRPGQRELAEQTYRSTLQGRVLMLQAPTGIGKTLGTLFPALMALARGELDRLFYLTSRNTVRQLAVAGVEQIAAAQSETPPLRVLVLPSREQACEYPQSACHGEACDLARGFFDRLPEARRQAVSLPDVLDGPRIRSLALEHTICPYYLAQELARWCDLVIADVNRYFDQHAILYALTRQNGWRVSLLIDEAHNLIARAREMYSAVLSQERVLALKRSGRPQLKRALQRLSRAWQEEVAEARLNRIDLPPAEARRTLPQLPSKLLGAVHAATTAIGDLLDTQEGDAELQTLLFEMLGFCRLAELYDDHSECVLSRPRRGQAELVIRNLIPADLLSPRFVSAHSAVLFSATLSPQEYYQALLGLPADLHSLQVASPFASEQLKVRIAGHISTRMRDREDSTGPIVDLIQKQYHRQPGNYLAYFSSFAYLDSVWERLSERHPEIPVWRQERGMSEARRQAFIDRFDESGQGVGFAVLGGAFGEGIDLPGRRLIGVFIATLGLPPFDAGHRSLQARLQLRYGRGYDYTYLYPGIQKVLQAAGRLIRSPDDQGVLTLIDDRYSSPQIRRLFPDWWVPRLLD